VVREPSPRRHDAEFATDLSDGPSFARRALARGLATMSRGSTDAALRLEGDHGRGLTPAK
jgi:hypothetical protein